MKLLSDLLKNVDSVKIFGSLEIEIDNVQYDSRKIGKNSLFIAFKGEKFDGHSFIPQAIAKGAKAIICENIDDKLSNSEITTIIVVNNARKALAQISHSFYDFPTKNMKIIGVTGTNGKTTITFLLSHIFERAGIKTGIIGTTGIFFNNKAYPSNHTTPESLELCKAFQEMEKDGVQCVAMEVSSHALSQHRADCIDFDIAIFTNLTHDHIDYHHSFDDYLAAKKRLFQMLKKDAVAIAFQGPYSQLILEDIDAEKYTCGRSPWAFFLIEDENISTNGCNFTLKCDFNQLKNNAIDNLQSLMQNDNQLYVKFNDNTININIQLALLGRFNIENYTLAAAAALFYGVDLSIIVQSAKDAVGAPGRMQRIPLKSGSTAIVDYAHTPDALQKALLACRELINNSCYQSSNLICVFGCGGDRDKNKRPVMGKISAEIADYVILTDDNPRTEKSEQILEEIYKGVPKKLKTKLIMISNRAEAIAYAAQFVRKDDLLLVAGKGHEKYQIIGETRIHFDDVEELSRFA